MVPLSTAIYELNAGKIEFSKIGGCCTTEGEVVTYLKRLEEFEALGLEPDEISALKVERAAAVRDIEEILSGAGLKACCRYCGINNFLECTVDGSGNCVPKWRGPRGEATPCEQTS